MLLIVFVIGFATSTLDETSAQQVAHSQNGEVEPGGLSPKSGLSSTAYVRNDVADQRLLTLLLAIDVLQTLSKAKPTSLNGRCQTLDAAPVSAFIRNQPDNTAAAEGHASQAHGRLGGPTDRAQLLL